MELLLVGQDLGHQVLSVETVFALDFIVFLIEYLDNTLLFGWFVLFLLRIHLLVLGVFLLRSVFARLVGSPGLLALLLILMLLLLLHGHLAVPDAEGDEVFCLLEVESAPSLYVVVEHGVVVSI